MLKEQLEKQLEKQVCDLEFLNDDYKKLNDVYINLKDLYHAEVKRFEDIKAQWDKFYSDIRSSIESINEYVEEEDLQKSSMIPVTIRSLKRKIIKGNLVKYNK